ncbi:MAG: MATE family efflux transporter [Lachnospiraceae bacterium]
MQKTEKRDLILNGNLITVIMTLAIPIVINSFIQTMYNLTDTYWMGQLGTNEMASITTVTPIQNIIINFGLGITTAGSILISQYLGAREDKQANIMARHIYLCSMVFAFACAGLCFAFAPSLIKWLGAEGDVFTFACTYLRIVILDIPFLFTINMYTAVYQSQGDTVKPMLLNLFGVVINMILDPLLMITFGLGVAGAAIATFASKIPCAVIALLALTGRDRLITISYRDFHFEKDKFKSILHVGLPTAIGGSTMQFGFLLMGRNVLKYGAIASAAYGIGNKINGLISLPSNAMGSATATIVGQNIGANQKDRAEQGYKLAMRIAVIFLFVSGLILSRKFIARPIVSIFSSDPEVIYNATNFLSLMALCCWTNGIYNATMGLFQGSGHTVVTMIIDASRIWVFRFLTLYICESVLKMGLESIWYSVVISNASSALIMYILYRMNIWKKDVVKIQKQ